MIVEVITRLCIMDIIYDVLGLGYIEKDFYSSYSNETELET